MRTDRPSLSTATFVNPHRSSGSAGLAQAYASVHAAAPTPIPATLTDLDVEIVAAGTTMSMEAFLTRTYTTALVVVVDGRIVHERYFDGTSDSDLLLGASMSKSVLATLVGLASSEGRLSVDSPVTDFVPELAGSGYGACRVHHLLTMTSGVAWTEDYRLPDGDGQRLLELISPGVRGVRALVRSLVGPDPPGTRWRDCTPDSLALDWVRERATGQDHATALSRLWEALGCEADAVIGLDGDAPGGGAALAGMAVAATARDWARLGMLQLDGRWDRRGLLDPGWSERARPLPCHSCATGD